MGWGGWEGGSRGRGDLALILLAVRQKPAQHCGAIVLQLKKIKKHNVNL